jgi:catechol 2,3-dioxygenase-like lactoylglutathione lyase family enzyme
MHAMTNLTRRQMLRSIPALGFVTRSFQVAARGVGADPSAVAGGAQAAKAQIRVRSLNHFGLAVSDPKRSVDFYQGLFGLPIRARYSTTTLMTVGSGPQFISIAVAAGGAAPSINHFCLGVDDFQLDRVMAALAEQGVTKADAAGTMKVHVDMRGPENGGAKEGTPDLLFGDPDGIVVQLQDASYCGGAGALGNACAAPEPSPKKALIPVRDLSHVTVFSTDPQRSNRFYQDLFGFSIRSYQGPAAPTLAVGPATQFLMFAGGGSGRGSAPSRPAAINHVCFGMDGFDPDKVLKTLDTYGIGPRGDTPGPAGPMKSYVTMRMENRGGAPGGTPELYFTDPDGLLIQLQDTSYCGGSGFLGDVCK